ncbi:MAG: hypothetical protein R2850_03790 [Bacteroidia bacterium]
MSLINNVHANKLIKDTLQLNYWSITDSENSEPIHFEGPENILQIIRLSRNNGELKLRYSKESRQFIDSIASLEHRVQSRFFLNETQLSNPNKKLVFNYLQTFCDIYLNGEKIGTTNNAFREWVFRPDQRIFKTDNTLEIVFYPPREKILNGDMLPLTLPADNQKDKIKTAPYIRQPQQEFGWDFCYPEIYTGFRVSPILIFEQETAIQFISVQTLAINDSTARLQLYAEIHSLNDKSIQLEWSMNGSPIQSTELYLEKGANQSRIEVVIPRPELWWPRSEGKPALHLFELVLRDGNRQLLDIEKRKAGIRIVELIQEADSIGTSFKFNFNGHSVFCLGANVVMPMEPFDSERVAGLSKNELSMVEKTRFNMLRIWGGGTYLPEAFHNWADSTGIMIWQDYMFACTYYPGSTAFMENVIQEADYQTKRMAAHASTVLFCGNNEIEVARKNWGWEQTYHYTEQDKTLLDKHYHDLFQVLLPQTVTSTHSNVPYLESSPVSNWGKPSDFTRGDNHDWGVWHGEQPIDSVTGRVPRFMSEYGFPSLPPAEVLEEFYGSNWEKMKPADIVLSYKGIAMLTRYIEENKLPSATWQDLIQSSLILQAKHYKLVSDSLIHSNGRCMGNLIWQLNEAAPVMSWSILDMNSNLKNPNFFQD